MLGLELNRLDGHSVLRPIIWMLGHLWRSGSLIRNNGDFCCSSSWDNEVGVAAESASFAWDFLHFAHWLLKLTAILHPELVLLFVSHLVIFDNLWLNNELLKNTFLGILIWHVPLYNFRSVLFSGRFSAMNFLILIHRIFLMFQEILSLLNFLSQNLTKHLVLRLNLKVLSEVLFLAEGVHGFL